MYRECQRGSWSNLCELDSHDRDFIVDVGCAIVLVRGKAPIQWRNDNYCAFTSSLKKNFGFMPKSICDAYEDVEIFSNDLPLFRASQLQHPFEKILYFVTDYMHNYVGCLTYIWCQTFGETMCYSMTSRWENIQILFLQLRHTVLMYKGFPNNNLNGTPSHSILKTNSFVRNVISR